MFKKFNWGHGILVFYICFVGVVVTALIASFKVDHSLVVDDYYAKDLSYQSQYEKELNNLQSNQVTIDNDKTNQELIINFKEIEEVSGTVDFYRPNDKSKDFKVDVTGGRNAIKTEKMLPGKWILKIDWREEGKAFYKED